MVWCQEEPKNKGAWTFVERTSKGARPTAPSTGARAMPGARPASARDRPRRAAHREQKAFIADALGPRPSPSKPTQPADMRSRVPKSKSRLANP